jgi:hypothetical protein
MSQMGNKSFGPAKGLEVYAVVALLPVREMQSIAPLLNKKGLANEFCWAGTLPLLNASPT